MTSALHAPRCDLTIGTRHGDKPLPRLDAGITYHHIVPWNELSEFWNTAVACNPDELRTTFIPALVRSMRRYPHDPRHLDKAPLLYDSATAFLHGVQYGRYEHAAGGASPDGINDFQAVYTWMPGNLFAGPTKRSDDSKDKFDVHANKYVDPGRYQAALWAHNTIDRYLRFARAARGSGAWTQAMANVALDAGQALARVAEFTEPVPHDPAKW